MSSTASHPPLRLILTFPSLSHFLSPSPLPSSLSTTLTSAALRSDSLTVLIRTPATAYNPWSPSQQGAASSSSSSSSASAPHPSSSPTPTPVDLWLPLERSLARLYSLATAAFLKRGNLLASVEVVVEGMRGLPFCIPSGVEVMRWDWEADGGNEVGAGKGKKPLETEAGVGEESGECEGETAGKGKRGIYDEVALGGTFDHLHAGHKILLTMACSIAAKKVVVGVSDDTLLQNKKFPHLLEPLSVRMRNVERFMDLVRPGVEKEVVPLTDVYGPTAHSPTIEALVVSDETRSGGDTINALRAQKGLQQLSVHVINLVADSSSSTSSDPSSTLSSAPPPQAGQSPSPSPVPAVKVEAAAKMGSTGIREWIDRQQRLGLRAEGGVLDKAGGTI